MTKQPRFSLSITAEEAQVLLDLIDLAVKSAGLKGNVAKVGVIMADKIEAAYKSATAQKTGKKLLDGKPPLPASNTPLASD